MPPTTAEAPSMVIVGGGHSGGRACQQLREQGWTGPIHLIAQEPHLPYERPPLSKGLLTGAQEERACSLLDESAWAALQVTRRPTTATALDTSARQLRLADGTVLDYRALLLATGGTPRTLSIPGADLPQVTGLRTIDDARRLKPRLRAGETLVVIGGGFIGLEVAASATALGMRVVVIEGGSRLMGRVLPEAVATRALDLHRRHGVDVRLQRLPQAITACEGGVELLLDDGQRLRAQAVVVGIGIAPDTALARSAGLAVQRGIVVDRSLRSSAPDVFACGDVAEFPSALTGQLIRQETWSNAETQARVAAANMLGGHKVHDDKPWFWSDQFDHQLQVSGEPDAGQRVLERPLGPDAHLWFYLRGDRELVGLCAWGPAASSAKDFKLARTLVERGWQGEPEQLADPAVKLKSLMAR